MYLADIAHPSDLLSSEESAPITSSSEWISDDTVTDSGSLTKSNSFENLVSHNNLQKEALSGNSHLIESPINQSCENKVYLRRNKNYFDSNYVSHPNYICDRSLKENDPERCNVVKSRPSYNPCSFQKNWEKVHIPSCSYSPQNKTQIPFVVQKKREKILSNDCCVPEYSCDLRLPFKDIDEVKNGSYCPTKSDCFNRLNHEIKKEENDSLLPESEESFSFKNFSHWCSDEYYTVS